MSRWTMLAAVTMLTLITALTIATFSVLGQKLEHSKTRAVFAESQVIELNENNLVGALTGLPLSVRISKANLDGSILSIELKIREESFHPSILYLNMAELIRFSFEGTSNVNQMLVRLVAEDKWVGTKHLLLASDVRRGAWPPSAIDELENLGDQSLPEELKAYFRFTVTSLWRTKFEDRIR